MTDTLIKIHNGSYRNQLIVDRTFKLVKPYKTGTKGGFVTVDGSPYPELPDKNIRIKVETTREFEVLDDDEITDPNSLFQVEDEEPETDEQIMDRLRERFEVLEKMASAATYGHIKGLVITGPPGVGKSHTIENLLHEAELAGKLQDKALMSVERGAASALGLYHLLYEFRDPGSVLVLDDADTVLYDETALNLLKAALDSGKRRTLSWRKDSRYLKEEDIPNKFDFEGSVIFITNLDFEKSKGKIGKHLSAILSRCHYLDLTIHNLRDKFLRCKQIALDGMLDDYEFTEDELNELLDFVYEHRADLREMSLRMLTKIADLKVMDSNNWQDFAKTTCMK